jgi:hypothetical protein
MFLFPPAVWLIIGSGPVIAAAPAELPSGDSEVFRMRMMDLQDFLPDQKMVPVKDRPLRDATVSRQRRISPARVASSAALPRLTSRFGYRVDPIRGGRRLHAGIDIPGPLGTPVRSSAAGTVVYAAWAGGYGNMIEVDHGGGLRTRYGHLSRVLVQPGIAVANGETIALMGSTGRSTGSHLHFEVRANGQPENPLAYLGGNAGVSPATFVEHTIIRTGPLVGTAPHVSEFARRRLKTAQSAEPGS